METRSIRLPNGQVINNVPVTVTREEIMQRAIQAGLATQEDFDVPLDPQIALGTPPRQEPTMLESVINTINSPDVLNTIQGATGGAGGVLGGMLIGKGAQLAARGTKFAPYAEQAAKTMIPQSGRKLVAEGLAGATAGGAAALATQGMEEGWQRDLAGMLVGAAVGIPAENAFSALALRNADKEGIKGATAAVSNLIGQSRARNTINVAFERNPMLALDIQRAADIERTTGVSLPTLARANGDATISDFILKQSARTDPESRGFTAAMKEQYRLAEEQLTKAKNGIAPTMEEVHDFVVAQAGKAAQAYHARQKRVAQTTAAIDRRIFNLNAQMRENPYENEDAFNTNVGNQLKNLLDAKEKAAIELVRPKYDELLNSQSQAGVRVPAEVVRDVYSKVKELQSDNIFSSFPGVGNKIFSVWAPKQASVSSKMAERYPGLQTGAKMQAQFRDVPLEELDSLKRAVKEQHRKAPDNSDGKRLLGELIKIVDGAIEKMPPSFRDNYRAIDKEYANLVANPFRNAEGVIEINNAKFVEQTVPKITGHMSGLKQVVDAIGREPDAVKIIEDAFVYQLANTKGIYRDDGSINPNALRSWLTRNKEKLQYVGGGLYQRLQQQANDVEGLLKRRENLVLREVDARKQHTENIWNQAYGERAGGVDSAMSRALSTPAEMAKVIDVASVDSTASKHLQGAMLSRLMSKAGQQETQELFSRNRKELQKLFGDKFKTVEDLFEAQRRLVSAPVDMRMNLSGGIRSPLEEATGTRFSTTASEVRAAQGLGIMSPIAVITNHFSRFFNNQLDKKEAAVLQQFLLEGKNLEEYQKILSSKEAREGAGKLAGTLVEFGMRTGSSYLRGALKGGIAGSAGEATLPQEATSSYVPSDPALLRGFGAPSPVDLTRGFATQ